MLQTVNQSNYRLQARLNLHRGIKLFSDVFNKLKEIKYIIVVVSVNDSYIIKYLFRTKIHVNLLIFLETSFQNQKCQVTLWLCVTHNYFIIVAVYQPQL